METELNLRKICTADEDLYGFMEGVLKDSFPTDEYRDLEQLRYFTDHNPYFSIYIIEAAGQAVGFISCWDFDSFVYVEHFALEQSQRNRNYGSRFLQLFCHLVHIPVVLEVECPETPDACRRVEFYQRNGFVLWDKEYVQPAYKADSNALDMRIMTFGQIEPDRFDYVRDTLYREVYGQ